MDELRIWNDVRTPDELRENMCRELTGDESGLIGYYSFNQTFGDGLLDISSSDNHGTLTNMDDADWTDSESFTTWTGTAGSTWASATNWTDGVPTATDNVGIPNYSNKSQPTLSSALNCNELVVGEGSTLTFDYTGSHTIHGSAFVIGRSDIKNGNLLTVTKSLYMMPYATLNIKPGGELTIDANLEADFGTFTIESDASQQGSLIVEGTSSGDITVQRFLTHNRWHYISGQTNISVNFGTSLGLTGGTNNDQFYRWEESMLTSETPGTWVDILNGNLMNSEGFVSCKGYAINYVNTDKTLSLSGVPYTTDQSINITKTDGSTNEGANLIGNPFTSTIALNNGDNNFITDNGSLFDETYGGIYLWNEQAGYLGDRDDYYTVSLAEGNVFAEPGQGFMIVKKDVGTSSISFNANIRQHGSAIFYKNSNNENVARVKLSVNDADKLLNTTTIAFLPNMTLGLDPLYDAGKLKGNPNLALYTKLVDDTGEDFAIQALPDNDIESFVIPVGVDVAETGVFEFSATQEQLDNYNIVLEDRQENTFTNLRWDSYFATISESGTGRFYLHFKDVTAIGEIEPETKITFRYLDGLILITNPDMERGSISLVNISGQVLDMYGMDGNDKQEFTINQASGIYIISIKTKKSVLNRKVFVK